jgi:hypothetical protein
MKRKLARRTLVAKMEAADFGSKVHRRQANMGAREAFTRGFEIGAEAASEARNHFIGSLTLLAKQVERAAETSASSERVNAAGRFQESITNQTGESFAKIEDMFVEFAARVDDELSGCGGRGSANVGDEIGDGEISFVANAGNYGNGTRKDGASDGFFVEGP